jgi:glycosyltransferase involved in cell wall biosynthesis
LIRLTCYSSGAWPCGIANYHRHLVEGLASRFDCETVNLPTDSVRRSNLPALLRRRRHYASLASRSDRSNMVLLQFITFWNGTREGENMLPAFLNRLRSPLYLVLHEWPDLPYPEIHSGHFLVRAAKHLALRAYRRYEFQKSHYDRWLMEHLFARARHILVHSEGLRDRLTDAGMDPGRITLAIHPPFPTPEPKWTDSEIDARLGTSGRRLLLLFGFPHPRKNYALALDALCLLPSDVVVVLAGSISGEFRRLHAEQLQEHARSLGVGDRFILTGELEEGEFSSLFRRAILGVAPFQYATGSGSIGYFAAAGLPVVASDLPSVAMLANEGAGLRLFPPGDSVALANEISSLLEDHRERTVLRDRSLRFARTHSFGRLADEIASQIESMVADI